jgi:hypothetical protein
MHEAVTTNQGKPVYASMPAVGRRGWEIRSSQKA